jgi:hypothetical protein
VLWQGHRIRKRSRPGQVPRINARSHNRGAPCPTGSEEILIP